LPSVLKVFRHVDFFCDTYQRTKNSNYLSVIKSIQVVNISASNRGLIAIRLDANSQAGRGIDAKGTEWTQCGVRNGDLAAHTQTVFRVWNTDSVQTV
jgi:hypothetical protein